VIVCIILIVICLTLGIIFSLPKYANNGVAAVLFATALAAVLYQFLGGIGSDTKVQLGVFKFGGSVAVLIGFMFLLKNEILPNKDTELIVEPQKGWIPISVSDGSIKSVKIKINGSTYRTFPDSGAVKEFEKMGKFFTIHDNDTSGKHCVLKKDESVLAEFPLENIKSERLFRKMKEPGKSDVMIVTLYPDSTQKQRLKQNFGYEKMPFDIKVMGSQYQFLDMAEQTRVISSDANDVFASKPFDYNLIATAQPNIYWNVIIVGADLRRDGYRQKRKDGTETEKYVRFLIQKIELLK
ncbi:hypothetical protein LJC37_03545, partial [Bacteroidales bacterium OttesenSCG-928-E04]|nr:hypothetical protein [Bacteroidales bacterium OttesenSCG-928-E04]